MRVLATEEIAQLEEWARSTQIERMLDFVDELPRFICFPKPVLLGSNNESEILIAGDTTTHQLRSQLAHLDEPFNPNLRLQKTIQGRRRKKPAQVLPVLYRQLPGGLERVCLLNERGACGSNIIHAHSVQRAVFKVHSKNGHVYQFKAFSGEYDEQKRLWPGLIGVNKATTFTGFCDRHDADVFKPIDTLPFQNSSEQVFLHHYRAFAATYYNTVYRFKIFENAHRELANRRPTLNLHSLQETLRINRHTSNELAAQVVL